MSNNIKKLISYFSKGNERTIAVKKNIIASLAIKGTSILISLMLVPITLGYISNEMYGIWLTLSSIMIWLGFFDIGFTLGLKNKLTEAIALHKWEYGKTLVSTTYFMMIIIFIPLCFILELLIPYINWSNFINAPNIYNDEITKTLYVLVAFFCIQMIVSVLTAVIAAYQKVALSSLFPVIGNFLSLLIIWGLTKLCSPSLISLAFAISAMPIVVIVIASFILYKKQFKQVSPSWKYINIIYIKDLFSLGAKFFIIQIQYVILFQCTNILISNISSPEDVTSYNIAYKYMNIAMMAYTIVLSPLWPAFTDAYTKKDYRWMINVYNKMKKFYFLCALLMLGMAIVAPFIYNIWIGDKIQIPTIMTFAVCLYMMIYNWDSLQVNLINGIGAVKLQTYVTLIGLFLHIPLSLFLGKTLKIGAIGVILSMILINLIYSSVFTIQINKIIKQRAKGVWLE